MILRYLVPASILAMLLSEATLIAGSYLVVLYLNHDVDPHTYLIQQSGWLAIAAAEGMILLGMYFRQLYSELRIRSHILLLQELILVMGTVFIAESLATYLGMSWALSRSILLPGSAIALGSVYVWRILFGVAIRNRLGLQRVLFIGFPRAAEGIAKYLGKHPEVGFAPVGYLDWHDARSDNGIGRLGSPEQLYETIESHRPDWIVVSERKAISAAQVDDLIEWRFGGVRVEDVGGFGERTTGRIDATVVKPAELIFSENLLPSELSVRFQSIYSTVAALLALPVVIPLCGVMAVLVRFKGAGPILIKERRVGQFGAEFTTYRFRSRSPEAHQISGWDKLPRIWNVLRGEMSVVGPEPDFPEFAARLNHTIPFYAQRELVRPGVIGWAQIQKLDEQSSRDAIKRIEYDLYYVKNLSPVLDGFIFLRWVRNAILFTEEVD